MKIEIIKSNENGFNLRIENQFYRNCKCLEELKKSLNELLEAKYGEI